MRLVYLAPAALAALLVGCGEDEPERVVTPPPPPPAAPQQSMPAPQPPGTVGGEVRESDDGPLDPDNQIEQPISPGNSPATNQMTNPPSLQGGGAESSVGGVPNEPTR